MKSAFFVILALCFITAASKAQTGDHFSYRIDTLPEIYSWDYLTDPNETGKLTEDKGSRPVIDSEAGTFLFDNQPRSITDTSISCVRYYDSSQSIYITFDSKNHWKSFTYEMIIGGGDLVTNFTLKLEDLIATETDSTYEVLLKGSQLLSHNFNIRWSNHKYYLSGNQSWDDVKQSTDSVNSLSIIALSISKSTFTKSSVKDPFQAQDKACYPNPASTILFLNRSIEADHIEAYSVLGRKYVLPVIHQSGNDLCEVSNLPPGIYYFDIGVSPVKFIISR
jgi:hypothetical protein